MKSKNTSMILATMLLLLSSSSCSLDRGMLEIEVQVIYSLGGPQPVARETFRLVDMDLRTLSEEEREHWNLAALNQHTVQSVQTDFQGKATFEDIVPGDYWVLGSTKTRNGMPMAWNIKVTINRGKNKLVLSNDNNAGHQ